MPVLDERVYTCGRHTHTVLVVLDLLGYADQHGVASGQLNKRLKIRHWSQAVVLSDAPLGSIVLASAADVQTKLLPGRVSGLGTIMRCG
jgi:hypothetical protein